MTDVIRPYRPNDRDGLVDVVLAVDRNGILPTIDPALADLAIDYYLATFVDSVPEHTRVIESDGRLTGFVAWVPDHEAFMAVRRARIVTHAKVMDVLEPGSPAAAYAELLLTANPAVAPEFRAAFPALIHTELLPELQGRGLGSRLVRDAIEGLTAIGSPGIGIRVVAASPAQAFYQSLGFVALAPAREGLAELGLTLPG